jgi:hypothetical protein
MVSSRTRTPPAIAQPAPHARVSRRCVAQLPGAGPACFCDQLSGRRKERPKAGPFPSCECAGGHPGASGHADRLADQPMTSSDHQPVHRGARRRVGAPPVARLRAQAARSSCRLRRGSLVRRTTRPPIRPARHGSAGRCRWPGSGGACISCRGEQRWFRCRRPRQVPAPCIGSRMTLHRRRLRGALPVRAPRSRPALSTASCANQRALMLRLVCSQLPVQMD